jgi:DNA-3-methyladenine glycosylase
MRLPKDYFCHDVLDVAPGLIGKNLVRVKDDIKRSYLITEVEAYRGEEDAACHARFGITGRNSIMYNSGGMLYVYLVYGIHWMLNIVTGTENVPQAVLLRGLAGINGPGRVTKQLGIDGRFNGKDVSISDEIWLEDNNLRAHYVQKPRIGIEYAAEPWKSIPWRFIIL